MHDIASIITTILSGWKKKNRKYLGATRIDLFAPKSASREREASMGVSLPWTSTVHLFFSSLSLSLEGPRRVYSYVGSATCARGAESMQVPCTTCAGKYLLQYIPAARHKPSSINGSPLHSFFLRSVPASLPRTITPRIER